MGTVGLNFGSPTSGAGFDVSSTVASIVANLQNVETPWKTQLTALKSQDTAISSLGTLLSNLSTDLSQLTDFSGIMAQKTGSSSDTNVLQLTSASSSAVAGTHSVVVKNLAQTSSGYLAPVTNAADKLSGSITLQVGSGAAQTITLNSTNNTLAGLASAINSSGVGITASVLTDSSGSRLSLVSGISGAKGAITVSANSIADSGNSDVALGYTGAVTGKDASLVVDGVSLTSASNTVTNLIPGLTFQLLAPSAQQSDGSLEAVQVVIGNDTTGVESTVNAFVSDYNSLISAINTQSGNDSSGNPEPLFGSPTLTLLQQQLMTSLNTQNPNGYLTPVAANANTTLAGSISIQVGSGTPQTIALDATDNTLAGLAAAINKANLGVTASVVTQGTQSTLSLLSGTAGSGGALTVNSSVVATSETPLSYTGSAASGSQPSSGTLSSIANPGDTLGGSISIQVGSGAAQTVTVDATDNTLAGLASSINKAAVGVTASVVTNSDGSSSLKLVSQTAGSAGNLTVTSNILDTSQTSTATLGYTNSSDLSTLANLGITVSPSANGTLSFSASTLDSALNADFSGVTGFFQNAGSWGMSFSAMLENAGNSTSAGMLSLALSSNSSSESVLNADISKEDSMISAEQKSLTAELNSANEIMQQLPSQLQGVNELYAAITGYNQQR
ncbi:MAG: flagellar filament capping protein FliD [Terracidiphilus sp.]